VNCYGYGNDTETNQQESSRKYWKQHVKIWADYFEPLPTGCGGYLGRALMTPKC
jgi:hypothetical protein